MKLTKKFMRSALLTGVFCLALGLIQKAEAASTDTLTVSVTPQVTYAVTITSVNPSGYQFGTVALAATTISTAAVGVKDSGTISEYFSMAISNTAPDAWTPGAGGTAGNNSFGMIAELAGTQPASASFAAGDALLKAPPGAAAT